MKNLLKDTTAARVGALLITAGSLAWTAYGVFDLLGYKGIPVIITVESVYLTLHYAEIKGVGGKWARAALWILGWIAALALGTFLCVHAAVEWGAMAAVPAAVPPLASKLLWWTDEQIRRRDSTEPTPEMSAEHARTVRNADHEARMVEAGIRADAAKEVARLKALGEVAMVRSQVIFQVDLDRRDKEDELRVRKPLAAGPAGQELVLASSVEEAPALLPVSRAFGFASALDPLSAPKARDQRVREIREALADGGILSIDQIRERYKVGKSVAYELRKEATE